MAAAQRVGVGTFGGISALPLRVAAAEGYFEAVGLSIDIVVTRDSSHLREQLLGGALFVAHAAPDNVIAWSDTGTEPFAAWLAGSNGPIALVARDGLGFGELRGKRIGVDSPTGGFAPILRQLLGASGVAGDDVELVPLGATRLRYVALVQGEIDATMLTLPWSLRAVHEGATVLADHTAVAAGLLTSCAVSTAERLRAEPDVVRAYADALQQAMAWLHDPARHDAAAALLAEDMDLPPGDARSVIDVMAGPAGWPETVRLVGDELTATWRLRSEAMRTPERPAEAYVHSLRHGTA